jgi:hypothetical protein
MQLTNEDVKRFVGGQMEILNTMKGHQYSYRGEISSIEVVPGTSHDPYEVLSIRFAWLAHWGLQPRWINCASEPSYRQITWVKEGWSRSFQIFTVENIGPTDNGGDRLYLCIGISSEVVILYPADGSKLDRAKVEDLEPTTA